MTPRRHDRIIGESEPQIDGGAVEVPSRQVDKVALEVVEAGETMVVMHRGYYDRSAKRNAVVVDLEGDVSIKFTGGRIPADVVAGDVGIDVRDGAVQPELVCPTAGDGHAAAERLAIRASLKTRVLIVTFTGPSESRSS